MRRPTRGCSETISGTAQTTSPASDRTAYHAHTQRFTEISKEVNSATHGRRRMAGARELRPPAYAIWRRSPWPAPSLSVRRKATECADRCSSILDTIRLTPWNSLRDARPCRHTVSTEASHTTLRNIGESAHRWTSNRRTWPRERTSGTRTGVST